MADKLLIPIEVGAWVRCTPYGEGELEHLLPVRFFAPGLIANSLHEKLFYSPLISLNKVDERSVVAATYYVPAPSRFLPADATPEQKLEALRIFKECCDHVRWSHRRALAGELIELPPYATRPLIMESFRYNEYLLEFNTMYEDESPLEFLKGLNLDVFNEDERFYVKAIIAAIEAGTK